MTALLRQLPPETAHRLSILGLRLGLGPRDRRPEDPILATRLWNLDFPNPIGLAAGFDKDAEVPDAMLAAGFGFAEAGTVTPLPQPGNPKPRLFRLGEDESAINRLGFNSRGLARFAGRLARRTRSGIVGANVGKNKLSDDALADYAIGIELLAPHADYLTINISSPNTPGLRDLQGKKALQLLISGTLAARRRAVPQGRMPPLLVKLAADLTDREMADIAEVALATGIDGLIISNTTVTRPDGLHSPDAVEEGGLSGRAVFPLSTQVLADMYRLTEGRLPLIGCGGVSSGQGAYEKILAGASLVQLYTALVFQGPGMVPRIKRELAELLRRDGFSSVAEAVGTGSDTASDRGRRDAI